ncbi:MAG: sensor histidine kinase [Rectinemataceae bacterium]
MEGPPAVQGEAPAGVAAAQAALSDPSAMLRRKYILALGFIALLSMASQLVIQLALAGNDDSGRVVNVAGRQRMLSQKIAKSALQILDAEDLEARRPLAAELSEAAELWHSSHDGLLHGDEELGIKGRNSPEILGLFTRLEPSYRAILDAAAALGREALSVSATQASLQALAGPILDKEAPFLAGMNAITFQYDSETRNRVLFTRILEAVLLLIMFGALALEALLIFRPGELELGRLFRDAASANGALEAALKDNRTLLRELQHRIKNTLAMISGIVSYSATSSSSPEAVASLESVLARIRSVSDLYSLLYSSESQGEVGLDEHFGKVVAGLESLAKGIRITTAFDPVAVSATDAAPLGIMLAELVTNAVKYAFPRGQGGVISLALRRTAGGARLEVADDGVGLPPGFVLGLNSGTGLTLVSGLAGQVEGHFSIENGVIGTICVVEFPLASVANP